MSDEQQSVWDQLRAERAALAARVETLTAERDEANGTSLRQAEHYKSLYAKKQAAEARVETLEGVTEFMWTVVCNVSEGDWTKQTAEWQEAAARAREQWHAYLASRPAGEETQG